MQRVHRAAVVAIIFALTCGGSWAARQHKSTPKERQKIVNMSKRYEENILAPEAGKLASDIMDWWVEVPDLTLNWCPELLTDERPEDGALAEAVLLQGLAAAGVFVIEHPQQESDVRASWIAGLEGVVRAYRNLLELDPAHRDDFLDRLVKIESSGKLGKYVDTHSEDCSSEVSPERKRLSA
jgi:hypothetical protein